MYYIILKSKFKPTESYILLLSGVESARPQHHHVCYFWLVIRNTEKLLISPLAAVFFISAAVVS